MEKLPHPVVPSFAVDVRIGPRNDGPVTGGLIALLHDEVHEIGVQGIGAEPDHRADALAEIEALAYPLVPGVALRLGERDERLRHLHDGEAAAPPREDIGRIETDGPDAAFERHILNGSRAMLSGTPVSGRPTGISPHPMPPVLIAVSSLCRPWPDAP